MDKLNRSRMTRGLGVLAAMLLLAAPGLEAQTGSVAGRVIDAQSGQTIPAAQVFIPALDIGVLSQQNGSYLLLNVPAGTQSVTVQRIGYREVTQDVVVAAGETAVVDFRITEEALQLDEIIITGTPGGTQRRAIGNTVATVSVSDVVQDVAVTNFQDLLTARTPGLQFSTLNGNVGVGSSITIRGVGSFDSNRARPLIYVDGVRVNNDTQAGPEMGETGGDGAGQTNVLDDFNPEDIESIEIIKGPAAASLYGTEASAGVIQIITKRGQEGAPQWNISVRQGTNFMVNPSAKSGTMYTCPSDPSPGPTDCQLESELETYNMYDEANRYIREGYFPWETENLYQNGYTQAYNVDVRGGSEQIRYFLSANYQNQDGIVWYNNDETFRLRGNVGVVFSENFSLDVSTGYVDGFTRFAAPTPGDGGVWQDLMWSNGHYLNRINPFDGSGPGDVNVRLGGFQEHLPSDVAEVQTTRDYSRFTGSATLNFNTGSFDFGSNVSGSLTSRAIVGIDKSWDVNRNVFQVEDGVVPAHLTQFTDTWDPVYTETIDGEMFYDRPIQTNFSFDYSVTANLDVADTWGFNSSFGAQYYTDENDSFLNWGQGFASPLSTTINQLAQSRVVTTYEFIENKSLGFYIQEEISYNDRIFVTGALRFDDNSTFGVDAPAQKYPKVSAAWVVSEESFWSFDAVNSLRLRGAWGKAGRQPDALSGLFTYAAVPGPGGASAVRPDSPGNPGIVPEVSKELEVGFDVALLDDRVSGEFTHYWRNDEDALRPIAIPPSFGFAGDVEQNVGRIDNWGWEALLSARVYEGDSFSFDLDLAADYTNNEIKELGVYPATRDIAIGYPYPNTNTDDWVLSAQFDPNGERANVFGQRITALCDEGVSGAPHANPSTPEQVFENNQYGRFPGGAAVPCADIPNQNLIIGHAYPTRTFSVAPRISLLDNQLQVFALAEGQYGQFNQDNGHEWGHIYNNSKASRLQNDPLFVYQALVSDDRAREVYDADFWKLREVGMRFTLPQSLVERTGAERASLAFSARNIWTIWVRQSEINGLPVTDPEFGDSTNLDGNGNFYSTPALSSLNLTLRVSF